MSMSVGQNSSQSVCVYLPSLLLAFALLLPAAQIDEQGQYSGEFYTFALAGGSCPAQLVSKPVEPL